MSDLVERVAMAIQCAAYGPVMPTFDPFLTSVDPRHLARAAITATLEAMQEWGRKRGTPTYTRNFAHANGIELKGEKG